MHTSISHQEHDIYNKLSDFHLNNLITKFCKKNLKLDEKPKPIH